jgi:plastocyanin
MGLLAGCSQPVATSKAPELATFQPDPATVGRITGGVRFTGKFPKPRAIDMDQDADCSKLYPKQARMDESMLADRDGAVANAFVYVKAGLEGKLFETPKTPVKIDQKGCWFEPRVFGIQTGQPFHVSNSDPVTHNIHPVAHENRGWNQSMAPESPMLTRSFALPEVMVPIKCNIHNWMRAWVGVLNHPYFAVSGRDGSYAIPQLPPGTYTIAIWHEKLGTQEQQVTLARSAQAELTFTFKGN